MNSVITFAEDEEKMCETHLILAAESVIIFYLILIKAICLHFPPIPEANRIIMALIQFPPSYINLEINTRGKIYLSNLDLQRQRFYIYVFITSSYLYLSGYTCPELNKMEILSTAVLPNLSPFSTSFTVRWIHSTTPKPPQY